MVIRGRLVLGGFLVLVVLALAAAGTTSNRYSGAQTVDLPGWRV
jgi:hypothetical protein